MIERVDLDAIIEINKELNEDKNFWVRKDLLEMTFSSYFYYEDEVEQIASVFRNLLKNHAFNNANKRTAAVVLAVYLHIVGYEIDDDFLVSLCYDAIAHDYSIKEIADKIKEKICDV